uniref:GRAM domain-containing protein 3-like n=1 Tax=Monopterus albus TaxID=43700 RepID=UPI0009B438C5|nr:GRAM domain-containing protein 3-like [Monopterus albus]
MSKKSKPSQSLDDAQVEIRRNHSLDSSISLRKHAIAEGSLEQSNKPISTHSFQKHNKAFHKLFPDVPKGENLIQTFTCALQKEVLYLGKLFVSERHVCFHSAVLLKDTKLVIPTPSIREVKKNNTALSMLSIQTVDGGKYSLVSLRDREMCSKILQSVCSNSQQGESLNSSALLCSAGNDDVASSLTPLEDSIDHDLSRQSSVNLDNGSHQMFGEGPIRFISTRQSSFTNEDDRAVSWMWRLTERLAPFSLLTDVRNHGILFYIYVLLTVLLLLVSGYIGLKIIALEEQLNSLGALTELSLHHREDQET